MARIAGVDLPKDKRIEIYIKLPEDEWGFVAMHFERASRG